jgi:uncharacterized membrane protein YvbJ
MFCSQCGTKIAEDSTFCISCGNNIKNQSGNGEKTSILQTKLYPKQWEIQWKEHHNQFFEKMVLLQDRITIFFDSETARLFDCLA